MTKGNYKSYIIDNISDFAISRITKETIAGVTTFTYGALKTFEDDALLTGSLEFETPDTIKTWGGGKIIDVLSPHPNSATGTFTFSKLPGAEFWNLINGWEITNRNEVSGLGAEKCSPAIAVQFVATARPHECGAGTPGERILIRLWNTRFKQQNLTFEAQNADGPAENTVELELEASPATDKMLKGHGVTLTFEDQDITSPTFNGDIFDDALKTIVMPEFVSASAGTITAKSAVITITNPLKNVAGDLTKTSVVVEDSTGSLSASEGAISGKQATVALSTLSAESNYRVFVNVGTNASPEKGQPLATFKTLATP